MIALRTSPPAVTDAEAARFAVQAYGLVAEFTGLAGERDRNFLARSVDGGEFVLKFIDPAAAPSAIDCQAAVLRHLAEQDGELPVPRLYPTLAGADVGRLPGPEGDRAGPSTNAPRIRRCSPTSARRSPVWIARCADFFTRVWALPWRGTPADCPSSARFRS